MHRRNKIPRIIKINDIKGFKVYCAFNNGEHRIIDFEKLFDLWKLEKPDLEFKITDPKIFKKVKLSKSGTLCWPNIKKEIKLSKDNTLVTFLDFDSLVLFENSVPDEKRNLRYKIGELLRTEREKAGLTQEELAIRSGTTKNYISRIENNKSDIELRTLRKIIEIGLNKSLELNVT